MLAKDDEKLHICFRAFPIFLEVKGGLKIWAYASGNNHSLVELGTPIVNGTVLRVRNATFVEYPIYDQI
jgi:hypothetical protein